MTAYYNENDEFAANWLRNLIKAGLIADGEVDTRSIVDVRADDLRGFAQCHFFAGIGGWSYALRAAGWNDNRPAWTGSCPCQPFSLAGAQRGFADERHLWPVWRDLVEVVRPPVVFGEQVASATEWLGLVRGDLEKMGYAVGALPIQAASAGADHLRDRYWFVADAGSQRGPAGLSGQIARQEGNAGISDDRGGEIRLADAYKLGSSEEREQRSRQQCGASCDPGPCIGDVSDAAGEQVGSAGQSRERGDVGHTESVGGRTGLREGGSIENGDGTTSSSGLEWVVGADGKARRVKPGIRLLAHGVPARVGKLRGFGNAIDHRPAKEFIAAYMSHTLSSQDRATAQGE